MSILMREEHESRDLHYGKQGGGQTLRFNATATAGENESQVWLYALTQSPPYFNGFIRNDIKVRNRGASHLFAVEVEYGTTGVGGGDQPLGGASNNGQPPPTPNGPAGDEAPLTSGYSISIRAPRLHLLHSIKTVSSTARAGEAVVNHGGAIGVGKDGKIEGCDVPPEPGTTLKRTVARATVTLAYLRTLRNLVGKVNDAAFYGQVKGEALFLSAEGQFSRDEGWSWNFEFGLEENRVNIGIDNNQIVVPAKEGWHYLWVEFRERIFPPPPAPGAALVNFAAVAHVEQVLPYGNFELIEIGT
jgi:hypothetical protein